MTELIYRQKPYERSCVSKVGAIGPNGGLVVDKSVFFPAGGGQPSDVGRLTWNSTNVAVSDVRRTANGEVELILANGVDLPTLGEEIRQEIDWDRRFAHMRTHTALHLLTVVVPFAVTSGSISTEKGRLDFDMPDPIQNREEIEVRLNQLVDRNLPVTEQWITDDELAANPGLVKTMSVKPPTGSGRVRLVRIGTVDEQIDLQPCGGTHVRSTSEIKRIRLGKIEKKGKRNRRVNIFVE